MIKLTSVKSKEEEKAVIEFLENYFLRNNFDTNGLTYMMIEDNKLVGVCGVDIETCFGSRFSGRCHFEEIVIPL